MSVEVCGVSHAYRLADGRHLQALRDVSLGIRTGELLCLLGPSGCGKSTLLRMIAGIEQPLAGTIAVGGVPVAGPGPDRGMVFQEYALFPWRTVLANVEFGLEMKRLPARERREVARRYLALVGLAEFEQAYPAQLSGGMQQRVAIARTLCIQPQVLLMDEPFGALDAITRLQMQEELIRIWQVERITLVFVTHDVEEAVYLADRIAVMAARPGCVQELIEVPLGRPRDRHSPRFAELRARVAAALGLEGGHGHGRGAPVAMRRAGAAH